MRRSGGCGAAAGGRAGRKETCVRFRAAVTNLPEGPDRACEWKALWDEVSKPMLAHVTIGVVSIDAGPAARILVLARMPPTARSAPRGGERGPSVLTAGLVAYFSRRYPPVHVVGSRVSERACRPAPRSRRQPSRDESTWNLRTTAGCPCTSSAYSPSIAPITSELPAPRSNDGCTPDRSRRLKRSCAAPETPTR